MCFICHYVARMSGKYTYREQIDRLVTAAVSVDVVDDKQVKEIYFCNIALKFFPNNF